MELSEDTCSEFEDLLDEAGKIVKYLGETLYALKIDNNKNVKDCLNVIEEQIGEIKKSFESFKNSLEV